MLKLTLSLFKILSILPFKYLIQIGNLFGLILFIFARSRRHVAETNLKLCFPKQSDHERNLAIQRIFKHFARSLLDRSLIWFRPQDDLKQLIQFKNIDAFHQAISQKRPVIILAPHFVGLDMAWSRLCIEAIESQHFEMISMYSHQKHKDFDNFLYNGRLRFNDESNRVQLVSRQDGVRPILKALKQNKVFYYLPDLDYGERDSVFVDFFGIPTATITGLSRLAKMTNAIILSCFTTQHEDGYTVEFSNIWDHSIFPTDDLTQDTQFMNHYIEQLILKAPDQYFWLHKRFKTRPKDQKQFY